MNLFEINNRNYETFYIQESPVYVIDNFYCYPDLIKDYFLSSPAVMHKCSEKPSYNGIHFLDARHTIKNKQMIEVKKFISSICKQFSTRESSTIQTNCFKLLSKEFNDYKNNYWYPHKDFGYNAIIDFSYAKTATNIYDEYNTDTLNEPEHYSPWRSKNKWKLLHKIELNFNRPIMFDGKKFYHGMDIDNDDFFREPRLNQVIFFEE